MPYPQQPATGSTSSKRTTISLLLSAFLIVFITLSFAQSYSTPRRTNDPVPMNTNTHASESSKSLTSHRDDHIHWEGKTAYGCSCACSCPTSESNKKSSLAHSGKEEFVEQQQPQIHKTDHPARISGLDDDKDPSEVPRAEFWTVLGVIGVLVCLGGIFAGKNEEGFCGTWVSLRP